MVYVCVQSVRWVFDCGELKWKLLLDFLFKKYFETSEMYILNTVYKIFILNWPTTIVWSRCSFLYAYIILNKLDLLYQRSCAIKLDVLSSLAISGLHANQ